MKYTNTFARILPVLFFLSTIFLISCTEQAGQTSTSIQNTDSLPTDTAIISSEKPDNSYMLLACLFQQQAAEYKALCYQAFNSARMSMLEDLKDPSVESPRAIITDIDETVLDNSPYQAACILRNEDYPLGWDEWCTLASANAVPGSLEFFKLAEGYGIDIFYVTNRKEHLREVTLKNLIALGYPDADDAHLLMRTETSDKEVRRQKISEKYHISILIGDNLGDFARDFYDVSLEQRNDACVKNNRVFGKQWIILPNPMYGDWESVFYKGKKDIDDSARLLILHDMLIDPDRL